MNNEEIIKILINIADILTLQNDKFRPRAYLNAARSIELLDEPLKDIAKRNELQNIPNVGEHIAKKIEELLKTNKLKYYNKLKKQTKINVEELNRIPSLGPKRMKILYEKLNIRNIKDLEKAIKKHKIQTLPGFTEKSEKNFSRLENFKLDIWDQDVQVGLTGAFLCVKHYGFQISKNPNGGVIINISSDLGLIAPDQRLYAIEGVDSTQQSVKPVSYSVVKSGLIGLTRYVATYWADKNVRCNAMCPGGVENNQPDDFIKKVSFRIPMGRLAQKDEYLSTLIWMLSESSSYLNGAIVPIDGGRTAW